MSHLLGLHDSFQIIFCYKLFNSRYSSNSIETTTIIDNNNINSKEIWKTKTTTKKKSRGIHKRLLMVRSIRSYVWTSFCVELWIASIPAINLCFDCSLRLFRSLCVCVWVWYFFLPSHQYFPKPFVCVCVCFYSFDCTPKSAHNFHFHDWIYRFGCGIVYFH